MSDLGEISGEAHIAAELTAREEIAKFHKEVGELVTAIEDYMIPRELTVGHLNATIEAFNERNSIVIPELKIGAIKKLFEKVSSQSHATKRS